MAQPHAVEVLLRPAVELSQWCHLVPPEVAGSRAHTSLRPVRPRFHVNVAPSAMANSNPLPD